MRLERDKDIYLFLTILELAYISCMLYPIVFKLPTFMQFEQMEFQIFIFKLLAQQLSLNKLKWYRKASGTPQKNFPPMINYCNSYSANRVHQNY